jgi:hypothetical protein
MARRANDLNMSSGVQVVPKACSNQVVRPPMKEAIARADQLHKDIVTQTRRILKATQKAEFICGGGEIVLGGKLIPHLKTVPGVGDLTACIWLSEIGDATRFKSPEQVAAICGYDPSLKVSAGQVTAQTRRKGNKQLYYIIGQAAGRVIKDRKEPLGQWGFSIQKRFRKGGQKKACGAVGRKLAVAMWVVHRDQVDFSYDVYSFWRAPVVPLMALKEMGFGERMEKLLIEHGYATSAELVAAYTTGELATKKGVGPKCLAWLSQWIALHRASSCAAKSSAAASAKLAPKKRKSSPTESCSKAQSSS